MLSSYLSSRQLASRLARACRHGRRQPASSSPRLQPVRCMTQSAKRYRQAQTPTQDRFVRGMQSNMTVRSIYPEQNIPRGDTPLHKFLFENLTDEDSSKVAICDAVTGQSKTYGQLYEEVKKFGSSLARHGLQRGGVVAIFMPNMPDYAVAFIGTTAMGGTVTTLNPAYTVAEVTQQLQSSSTKLLVTCAPLLETATLAAKQSSVESVLAVGVDGETDLNGVRVVPFSKHVEGDDSCLPEVTFDIEQDLAVLPFSSGTTGMPKGVELTHRNIIANVVQMSASPELVNFSRRENESILCVLPFFHIYGMVVLLLNGLHQRTRLVTLTKFEPESFLGAVQREKITQLFVAPPLALFLVKHPLVAQYDLSSVYSLLSGGAPLGGELEEEVVAKLGWRVLQGYGLSETSPVLHMVPFSAPRHGSVGLALPNTEVSVTDLKYPGEARMVGKEISGEICVRGPQVMRGYLNRPDTTAEMLDKDGWLHTGDIGYHDQDGYLFVTDRLKELIKRKGFQVAPAELERELLAHPMIADAAVIGVPDERDGELPRAYVVKKADAEVTEDSIMEFMSSRVAAYKQLDGGIVFTDIIPKSASGKILRRELRALIV